MTSSVSPPKDRPRGVAATSPRHNHRRLVGLITATSIALLLAACGSAKPAAGTTTDRTPRSSNTGRCRSRSLRLSYLGSQGATGNIAYAFELTNRSSTSCTLLGYPGFAMDSQRGAREPVVAHHPKSPSPTKVVLAPGKSADVEIFAGEQVTSSFSCYTASTVLITPPDAHNPVEAHGVALRACGPTDPVSVTVFPLAARSS